MDRLTDEELDELIKDCVAGVDRYALLLKALHELKEQRQWKPAI